MSTDPGYGKKLSTLLRSIGKVDPPAEPSSGDPLEHLVYAFLLWEASTSQAERAFRKLMKEHVDLNDLRMSMPDETVEIIGVSYPRCTERAQRLRACLKAVYLREHRMSFEDLAERNKRDIRTYLETLDGMVPYVMDRVLLLGFGAHGVPVDEQLRKALIEAEALDETLSVADASAWLARQIKADQAEQSHYRLQAHAEGQGGAAKGKRTRAASSRSTSSKKKTTTKKKTTKKSTTKKRAGSR